MDHIWQTVLAIIGSIGGAGAIIVAVVKFSSEQIAAALAKKYEIKLSKELESYKAGLDKKTYISRARFDMEFAIYGKLSEAFLLMRDAVYWLFPSGIDRLPLEEDAKKQVFLDRYTKSGEAIEKAQTVLGSNAPFIPAEFYADFEEIRRLCMHQYTRYTWCGDLASEKQRQTDCIIRITDECYESTDKIFDKYEKLINKLREYLENLEVSEE